VAENGVMACIQIKNKALVALMFSCLAPSYSHAHDGGGNGGSGGNDCTRAQAYLDKANQRLAEVNAFLADPTASKNALNAKLTQEQTDLTNLIGTLAPDDDFENYIYADEIQRLNRITNELANFDKYFSKILKFATKKENDLTALTTYLDTKLANCSGASSSSSSTSSSSSSNSSASSSDSTSSSSVSSSNSSESANSRHRRN